MRECEEQVVFTDYESIVGLEFDAVFLPGCERVLAPRRLGPEAAQAVWVALTRARQYIGVSHVDPIGVFNVEVFRNYRTEHAPPG